MLTELKPCPFCGGTAYIEQQGTRRHSCITECGSCGARLESGEEGTACGNAWNTRAASAAPAEGREPTDTYKGSNLEIIAQALYCNEHGDTESCENWLHLLRDRLATAPTMSEAARDVLAERRRQIGQEGWTAAHDDEHVAFEMAFAAASYAMSSARHPHALKYEVPGNWPWSPEWWRPTTPRRDLVKAGALILAEIERIDRAAAKGRSDGPASD
jgi:Lar family restriction alleviation protein